MVVVLVIALVQSSGLFVSCWKMSGWMVICFFPGVVMVVG